MASLPLAREPAVAEAAGMRIEIPLYDGFDEVDAVGPFEVLGNAAHVVDDLHVELVGAHGAGEVRGAHGLRVMTAAALSERADLVLVPGGGWRTHLPGPVAVRREHDRGVLPERLAALAAGGAAMASVCTGAMLLAKARLTTGRPATTHRAVLDDLEATGALVDREARVVDDGDLLTCGGVTSGLDLALHLVQREHGAELADAIAALMEHERRGPVRTAAVSPAG